MSWPANEDQSSSSALISWKGQPLSNDNQTENEKALGFTLKKFWGMVKGYTANDINRLKEAAVRQVEGKAAKDLAEAEERIAYAAKAHAEAEKARAEAFAIRIKSICDNRESRIAAVERFEEALSRIKQNGGDVAFDAAELRHKLYLLGMVVDDKESIEPKTPDL